METTEKACCMIHNISAKERGYARTMKFRQDLEEEENMQIDILIAERDVCQ